MAITRFPLMPLPFPSDPRDPQRLTKEQKELVKDYLVKNWPSPRTCPISGHTDWTIVDHLISPAVYTQGGMQVVGGSAYPQVMVVCQGCGYTVYFNAVKMGIVPPLEQSDGEA